MRPIELVISRAKARCTQHRGRTQGFCSLCFRVELESYLASENPSIPLDTITRIVDEWMLAAERPAN